ncbi:MAG: hypothetical protein ACP5FU_06300 [Nitrososphaeria archaeon]
MLQFCAYLYAEAFRCPIDVVRWSLAHALHSDLNRALNILKRAAGLLVQSAAKPLTYLVLHD